MSATVVLSETNGPSASQVEATDISNINMGSDGSAELVPATHPVTAQTDGHAFEKWIRFYVTAMGGSSQIDNLKVWLNNLGGGWKTGEGMSCTLRESGYVQPTYNTGGPIETDSVDADQVMPETEPSGPNHGIGGVLAGTITSAPTYSDYMVIQLDVTAGTPAGAVNTKTFVFQWDEM